MDGTLLDSAQGITETLRYTFAQMQTDITGVDLHRFVGPPLRVTFGQYYPQPQKVEQAVDIYRAYYKVKGSHLSPPYAGVPQMLRRLKKAGLMLYTATSKPIEVVTPILEEQGIADCFTFIGGASMDASVDTKEAVIRLVCQRPELAGKRLLMVGDRKDDLLGAARWGLPAVGVLYGYGSRQELSACNPLALADTVEALENYIIGENEV